MVLWTFPILPSNPPLGQRPRDKTEEEVRKPILHQHLVTEWPILLIFTGIDAPIQTFIKYRVANPIFNYNWYQDSNTGPPGSGCVVLPTTPRVLVRLRLFFVSIPQIDLMINML